MKTSKTYQNKLPAGNGRLNNDNAGVRFSHGKPECAELVLTILRYCKYRITSRGIRLVPGIKDYMFCNMGMQQTRDCLLSGGLPAGNRNSDGNFNNLGNNAKLWSSTENNGSNAWNRNLNNGNNNVNRNNNNKSNGFSVRCLKDLLPTSNFSSLLALTNRKCCPAG